MSLTQVWRCLQSYDELVMDLILKDQCPVNASRAQNLAGHFLGHEIRLVFVSLGSRAIPVGIN